MRKLRADDRRINIRVSGKICDELRRLKRENMAKGKRKTTIQILEKLLKING